MADVKITDNSDEFRKEMEKKIDKSLEMIGLQAEGDAKLELENTPRRVDTGRLRNSITYAHRGKSGFSYSYSDDQGEDYKEEIGDVPEEDRSVYIGTNVEYAPEIHEGRPGLDPNRFLRNAVEKNQETFKRMIEDTLKE